MKRWLFIAVLVIGVLGALLYALAGTEPGLRWVAARVAARLPAGTRFDEIRGRLLGPIDISNVRVTIAGNVVEIGHAHIEWAPADLMQSSVHVSRVEASDVRLQLAPRQSDKGSASPMRVSLQIDALDVERFDIVPAPDGKPVRVDRLAFAGTLDADGIDLRSVRAQGLGANAEGEIAFGAKRPLAARIAWTYTVAGLPPLAGELRANGEADAISVEQNLAEPYRARFEGTLDAHARRLQGRLRTDGLSLDALRSDWPPLAIDATADIDATLDGMGAVLTGTLTPAGGAPIDVSGTLAADREQLTIKQANLSFGSVTLAGEGNTSLRALLNGTELSELPIVLDLSALDVDVPQVGHVRGTGHLEGTFSRHELSGQGQIETPLSATGTWTLAAHGEARTITIDELTAQLGDGRGSARGTVDWGKVPGLHLQVSLRGADPGALWRDATGQLDADGSVALQKGTGFALTLDSLSGKLRGQPVSGHGSVRYASGAWRIDTLMLAAGDAHFTATGEIAERATVQWNLEAPQLGTAIPGWSGSLRGTGRVTGSAATPMFEGELYGAKLSLPGMTADVLEGSWSIDVSGRAPSRAHVEATTLVVGGRRLDTATIDGKGPIGQHAIDIALRSGDAHADVGLTGDWKNGEWHGRLERLDLDAPATDRWSLVEPVPVLVSASRVQLDQTCLQAGASQSCFNGEWRSPHTWAAKASLEQMPLAVIAPALPQAFGYRGKVAGDLDVKGTGSVLSSVAANLTLDAGTITKGDPPQHLLGWDRVHAEATLAGDRLVLKSSVALGGDAGEVTLDASLHSADLSDVARAPLEGRIAGLVMNVPLVKALSPDLAELRGETRLDLRISGTLLQPEIYGDASIQHGAAAVPRFGVSLHDVMLAVHGDGRTLNFDGEAQSGKGKVVFTGQLAPDAQGWQGNATISGQDFRLVELPEITGDISPDVRITLNGRNVRVEGDVSVPRANVAPRDFAGAVRISPDAVVVGPTAETQEQSPWLLDAQLRLVLGADVTFHGFGLDADIGGSVVATDKPGLPTTGSGELNVVQGTYTAYGRQLTIDHGRLLFNGGLIDNPALDARASRHLEAQSVGVDVRGTLRKPELRLYSDPPLSQSDALAYLLIGRPVGSLSGGEQAELADTTRQIGISGAGFLAQTVGRRIGTEVGIEEIGVGEENREERTALFIGKYLSPKLYIGYGVGLFETVNTWRVRYFLTPRLLLQAESGQEHSADVIYSIDR